ncbi:MAG: sulfite exporter TauE/SafE family protein [Oscillospiraceae bacterium]|nr:sulfite exporter TauE/SafE family protein [Oscillospiraceae bacterium]
MLLPLLGAALLASFVQGVTGFAIGICLMSLLPLFLPYTQAVFTTMFLLFVFSVVSVASRRKKVRWRVIALPVAANIVCNYLAILFLKSHVSAAWGRALGVFLILLGLYFFFLQKRLTIRPGPASGLVVGALCGLLGGLFGVSGPPLAVYLVSLDELDKEEFFATAQGFSLLTAGVDVVFRLAGKLAEPRMLLPALAAVPAVLLGLFFGQKLYAGMSRELVRKLVYVLMIVSGIRLLF